MCQPSVCIIANRKHNPFNTELSSCLRNLPSHLVPNMRAMLIIEQWYLSPRMTRMLFFIWESTLCITETETYSFWWHFHHWLHLKLSKWQLPVQPLMKISSKWRHFRFSDSDASVTESPGHLLVQYWHHTKKHAEYWLRTNPGSASQVSTLLFKLKSPKVNAFCRQ